MSEVENVDPVVSETVVSENVVPESEGEEVNEIMNNEGPVETESTSEVTVEPAIEEEEAEEEPAPADTTEPEEPAPSETTEEPAPTEPVSTQEVVQNVQEILSSTETNVSGNDLEERVKVLEERLEKFINISLKTNTNLRLAFNN